VLVHDVTDNLVALASAATIWCEVR